MVKMKDLNRGFFNNCMRKILLRLVGVIALSGCGRDGKEIYEVSSPTPDSRIVASYAPQESRPIFRSVDSQRLGELPIDLPASQNSAIDVFLPSIYSVNHPMMYDRDNNGILEGKELDKYNQHVEEVIQGIRASQIVTPMVNFKVRSK